MTIDLYTKKDCPGCLAVKAHLNDAGRAEIREIDIETPDGLAEAAMAEIVHMTLPTVVNGVVVFSGANQVHQYLVQMGLSE